MPSDEAYEAVLRELRKLFDEMHELKESNVDALRIHRDVVFRAINLLNHEVITLVDRQDKDDTQRAARQQQLDAQLSAIRRWQWIRIVIEALLLLMGIAYLYGASR